MKKIIYLFSLVFCCFIFVSCENKKEEIINNEVENDIPLVSITGLAKNVDSEIYATLMMSGNSIKDIEFSDNMDPINKNRTESLYQMAKEKVLQENSFLAIDTVSGATITINAMKEAIKDALSKNGYDLINFGYSENTSLPSLNDGLYTGVSYGMNGDVYVDVEIVGGKINNIVVATNSETQGIGSLLYDENGNCVLTGMETPIIKIPKEIMKYNTCNVDTVSGATVTSEAIKFATKKALIQAGAMLDDFTYKPHIVSTMSDMSCDVLVIGAGGAGLASAITASENGANVIIIDKNGVVGGNTLMCGGIYNSPDTELQNKAIASVKQNEIVNNAINIDESDSEELIELKNKVKNEFDSFIAKGNNYVFDSPSWFELQTYLGGDKIAKLPLLKVLSENAANGLEFLKNLGLTIKNNITQGPGSLWLRTHSTNMNMGTGFISAYLQKIESCENIKLFVETKCTKLNTLDNKIVGAMCVDKYGKEFNIDCKSVIIATGGFSANKNMINTYNDHSKWDDLTYVNTTNRKSVSNGDGITLATDVGADICDMNQIQLLYLSEPENGQIAKYPKRCVNAIDQVIFVNKEGKRFVNEDGRRDDICKAIMEQTDGIYYIFESGDGKDYEDIYDPSWRSADGFTLSYLVDNGYVVVADTIEELCAKLSIDFDTFHDTIYKYDEGVLSHNDEFGRTNNTTAFSKGPYIMTKRTTAIHHTMGGLVIDEDANVLDKDGNKIEGLFACGEVTGGIHGGNRLGGNAVTDTVVFGRIAGENAAK